MLTPDNQNNQNSGGLNTGNDYDFSRKIDYRQSHIQNTPEIFEFGFGISDCVKYLNENPASGTFMLVIDANPVRLLGINSEIVTAIPRTPGGFHSDAVLELADHLKKKNIQDIYSNRGNSHLINGTVGPGRIDLRIDGGNESLYFYKSIEILTKICSKYDLKLYVFETTGKNKVQTWGLAHLKANTPKVKSDLKLAVDNRKVGFYLQNGSKKTHFEDNYYAFAAGTRYISLELLNKIIYSLEKKSSSEAKKIGLNAIINLNRGISLNFRGTAFDIDFLLVDKNLRPLSFKDSKVEKLRAEINELAEEASRHLDSLPDDNLSDEFIETLNEICHIYNIKFENFVKNYKKELPEVLRNNATDTYDWNFIMYQVLYGSNQDPWKNLGQVEISSSYSLSLPNNRINHLYSSDIGTFSSSPQIVYSQMPAENIIALNYKQEEVVYRKRSLGMHCHDLQIDMLQALNDEDISILNSNNLLPEAMYFGQIFKLGESHNTQAARVLSISNESERYVLILSYPDGEEKIMLFTSINNFLEYAKISQARYWKSYFTEDDKSLINYCIDYSNLQNSYYEYLYSLLSDRAEVRVNKARNDIYFNSCSEPHFTLTEYVQGYSPKDKKPIDELSNKEFEQYLSQLAVAVVCHIVTQKTRSIGDDCVYDNKNLTITNTNTALDPEGFFDDEKDLTAFIYLQTILPAYNILIRKNSGDLDVDNYLNYFIKEVSASLTILRSKLNFDRASDALNLGQETLKDKLLKLCRKNSFLNGIISIFGSKESENFSKLIFRDHLSKAIRAFNRTENINTEFKERLLKIYNFLDYQVPTQNDDIRHDVLTRYTSILSLASIERTPFTQDEVIKRLHEVITSDTFTTNFTNEDLYRNEVYSLDLIYVALDLEVKRVANKKIVQKLPKNMIPRFLDLVEVAIETKKVNDFVDFFNNNFSELKVPDEKLTRFHAAAKELEYAFNEVNNLDDYLKHLEIISKFFEKRDFVSNFIISLRDKNKLSKLREIVYSFK